MNRETDEEGRFRYQIWAEGFSVTGQRGTAQLMGNAYGHTFKEACERLAQINRPFRQFYNPETNTYWGSRLFDNEVDARASFE